MPPISSGHCGPSCRPRFHPSSLATWYVGEMLFLFYSRGERLCCCDARWKRSPTESSLHQGTWHPDSRLSREMAARLSLKPLREARACGGCSLPAAGPPSLRQKSAFGASGSDRGCREAGVRGLAPTLVSHDTGTQSRKVGCPCHHSILWSPASPQGGSCAELDILPIGKLVPRQAVILFQPSEPSWS